MSALDAGLVPPLFVAVTVNEYWVPFVNPVTTQERAVKGLGTHDAPDGDRVTA